MTDLRWQSAGGILLDGTGDIQTTDPAVPESLVDMIMTVLKADRNSWQLYDIGANLSYFIGQTVDPELELKVKRAITDSLIRAGVLPKGSFFVETLASGQSVTAIVYIGQTAISTVTIPGDPDGQIRVQ
jgi:hypothetical protein